MGSVASLETIGFTSQIILGRTKLDQGSARLCKVLALEAFERNTGKVGIRNILCAVRKSDLKSFRKEIDVFRRVHLKRSNIIVFQHIQNFDNRRAAGRGRGRRNNRIAAVITADRSANLDLKICKVFQRHGIAILVTGIDNSLCHRTGVKSVDTLVNDFLNRCCKFRIRINIADFIRHTVFIVDLFSLFCNRIPVVFVNKDGIHKCANRKTFSCKLDRRRKYLLSIHRTIVFQCIHHTLDIPRNSNSLR